MSDPFKVYCGERDCDRSFLTEEAALAHMRRDHDPASQSVPEDQNKIKSTLTEEETV